MATRARVDNPGALTRLTIPRVWTRLVTALPLRDVLSLCLSWRGFARVLRDYVDCDFALADTCRMLWLKRFGCGPPVALTKSTKHTFEGVAPLLCCYTTTGDVPPAALQYISRPLAALHVWHVACNAWVDTERGPCATILVVAGAERRVYGAGTNVSCVLHPTGQFTAVRTFTQARGDTLGTRAVGFFRNTPFVWTRARTLMSSTCFSNPWGRRLVSRVRAFQATPTHLITVRWSSKKRRTKVCLWQTCDDTFVKRPLPRVNGRAVSCVAYNAVSDKALIGNVNGALIGVRGLTTDDMFFSLLALQRAAKPRQLVALGATIWLSVWSDGTLLASFDDDDCKAPPLVLLDGCSASQYCTSLVRARSRVYACDLRSGLHEVRASKDTQCCGNCWFVEVKV